MDENWRRQVDYVYEHRLGMGWRPNTEAEDQAGTKNRGLRNHKFVVQMFDGDWGSEAEGFDGPTSAQRRWLEKLYEDVVNRFGEPQS